MQTLQKFNRGYSALFDEGDDEPGDDGEERGAVNNVFHKQYGWFYSTKQVAEYEGVKLSDVWDFKVMHVLNDLSYLKAKKQHEEAQLKRLMK